MRKICVDAKTSLRLRRVATLVLCSASTYCYAQANNAEITGTVSDSSGAVIAQASVQVVDVETQAKRTVQTSSVGSYVLTQLQSGHYSVSFHKDGFADQTQTSINLEVNQILTLDPKLMLGSASETVQVQAKPQSPHTNPFLRGDLSDQDAIRVGDDFYAISSTFQYSPGMVVLHSRTWFTEATLPMSSRI